MLGYRVRAMDKSLLVALATIGGTNQIAKAIKTTTSAKIINRILIRYFPLSRLS